MTVTDDTWSVRLASAAETDFELIIGWTLEQFGDVQARLYAQVLSSAVEALCAGPNLPGAKARSEIGKHLFTLHVARQGKRGRHFILFRVDAAAGRRQVDVLRILHDAMDIQRHIPEDE
jgi:toxin ParE1/3/4